MEHLPDLLPEMTFKDGIMTEHDRSKIEHDRSKTERDRSKDAYERMFLEILLRHQLPEEATVRITVTPKVEAPTGDVVFTLKRDRIDVDSHLEALGLSRTMPPPNW